jgi:anti-sigma-K factor RskA
VVAVVVTAAAAVASCCDSVATATLRGGSPVVAALLAAGGTLDERRLVGTDASDLSALAGARAGTVGATLRTQRQKTEL